MPVVTGVLETALYVDDLERAAHFYQKLFGFAELLADERMRALNVADKQVLLLFKKSASKQDNPVPGGIVPPHDVAGQLHMAFAIPAESLSSWASTLDRQGITIESEVHAERGGHSLYFRDPDGNLIELATPGLWQIY